ncbi:MAG: MFS transporter, partial [Flavitalea sp.]
MSDLAFTLQYSKRAYRIAVSSLFFLQGLCFASWASRIPSIQKSLHLSDTSLGIVLFSLPLGSIIALPFSGWAVTRFGSKRVATNAILIYCLLLVIIGVAHSTVALVITLVFFGMAGNMGNIAMNTQAVGVEAKYGRKIMASFHGLWSVAGFSAAGIGAFMIGKEIMPFNHFILIAILIMVGIAISFQYLLPDEEKSQTQAKLFAKPDRALIILGMIGFCCMICEGAMFDWSGIYFQKVIQAEKDWVGIGYTAFMGTMAGGRFIADWVTHRLGIRKTIQFSGALIATGLLTAVIFPNIIFGIAGFFLVGLGVSSVIPLVYSE